MSKENVLFCWSGGKDSALALFMVLKEARYDVAALLTTVTEDYDRISMHGVRRVLLEQQAEAIGLPLEKVLIPRGASNDEYESSMRRLLEKHRANGITKVVFGDIFLEDIRAYREQNLAQVDMQGVFPLWEKDSGQLARAFIDLGFRAFITCVDTKVLDARFAGRLFDERFVEELPPEIDPCGENGEFHSFVFDGPIFSKPVPCTTGEIVLRDERFCYCDILPSGTDRLDSIPGT